MAPRRTSVNEAPDTGPGVSSGASLQHIMLVGGTSAEWDAFSAGDWAQRVEHLVGVARAVGARWVTVRPVGHDGAVPPVDVQVRTHLSSDQADQADDSLVTVIVDPEPDARTHFARALGTLAAEGVSPEEITEDRLARILCRAPVEPDLAVILGPADRLPTSVSWELAYAEMVFLDVAWSRLSAHHLGDAVEQFARRDRRFGGVDP